jgi:hypothetical protein
LTQNWHCSETTSIPVMGIRAVGVMSVSVMVGAIVIVLVSEGMDVGCAGELQDEINKTIIDALNKSLREKIFISWTPRVFSRNFHCPYVQLF